MVSLVLLNWIYLKVMQNPGGSTAAAVYASESAGVNPTSTPAFTLCCSLRRQRRRCQQLIHSPKRNLLDERLVLSYSIASVPA